MSILNTHHTFLVSIFPTPAGMSLTKLSLSGDGKIDILFFSVAVAENKELFS